MKGFAASLNRGLKAKKIEAVLKDFLRQDISNLKILDVGAGDGKISSYFVKNNDVYCVDIYDQRKFKMAKFKKVNNENLPFNNLFFDIVISNHVIEHLPNQNRHLKEINRVLKDGGVCYMATPNKNFFIEPHYKIPLIHYLKPKLFYKIIKILKIYKEDIYLLNFKNLCILLNEFFNFQNYTPKVIKYYKKFYIKKSLISFFPLSVIKKLNLIIPTYILVLSKKIN